MRVGVITGLASEAACLSAFAGASRPALCCVGARPAAAAAAADRLIEQGCEGLVSFGTAGGLDPALLPGTVVLAESVLDQDGSRFLVDVGWRRRLAASLTSQVRYVERTLLGRATPLNTPRAKLEAHRTTGAAAVDMESQAVGARCTASNTPFLVVRVIADSFDQSIPSWLTGCIGVDGRPELSTLLAGLIRHPSDTPRLIGLARSSRRAVGALRRVALLAGPFFQLDG